MGILLFFFFRKQTILSFFGIHSTFWKFVHLLQFYVNKHGNFVRTNKEAQTFTKKATCKFHVLCFMQQHLKLLSNFYMLRLNWNFYFGWIKNGKNFWKLNQKIYSKKRAVFSLSICSLIQFLPFQRGKRYTEANKKINFQSWPFKKIRSQF